MTIENPWTYRADIHGDHSLDIIGFDVETLDGKIGKVDEANNAVGDSYVVVDTGPWIFGKKVLLPAGTVNEIDPQKRKIYVGRTKEEIRNAPPFDESKYKDTSYRDEVEGYYAHFPGTM
jgi:hypothetical protein